MTQFDRLRRLFAGDVQLKKRRPIRVHPVQVIRPPAAVALPKLRKSFFLRRRPDGVPDILDAIQELGGIASPAQSRFAGKGDYDGFAEAFQGSARVLIRRTGGQRPDQLVEALNNPGSGLGQTFRLESTSDRYDAVSGAVTERELAKRRFEKERIGQEFFDRVLAKDRCGLNTQGLKVGDRFKVKRDLCHVRDIDPDSDEVDIDCTPRFGRQRLPDNAPFNPENCRLEPKLNPTGFFDELESVEAQKKRLAAQAAKEAAAAVRVEIKRRQAAPIVGRAVDTTGELFDPTAGDAPLFALKKAFAKK